MTKADICFIVLYTIIFVASCALIIYGINNNERYIWSGSGLFVASLPSLIIFIRNQRKKKG